MYSNPHINNGRAQLRCPRRRRTKILDLRGFDSSIININIKGWNSHVHREFAGRLESSSLSREILSRETRRTMNEQWPRSAPLNEDM